MADQKVAQLPKCAVCAKTRNLGKGGLCWEDFWAAAVKEGAKLSDAPRALEVWGGKHDRAPEAPTPPLGNVPGSTA